MLLAYRPRVPLAQTTFGAAALRPRSSASPSGGAATHCARAACGSIRSAAMSKDSRMNQASEEENIRCRRHNIETRHVSVSGQPADGDVPGLYVMPSTSYVLLLRRLIHA